MTFENAFEASSFLLGLAGSAVVVAPAELRADLRTAGVRIAQAHSDGFPADPPAAAAEAG